VSKRLYPHKRVRYWYGYDIDDICTLFSDLGLHPQTVRKWIKNGLKTMDAGKPALVYGHDLIAYLKKNNNANKCKTAFDEIYCMGCQDARPVFRNKIAVEQKSQFLKVQGACRECKKPMFKNYKLSDFPALRQKFTLVGVLELYDFEATTDKTHIHAQEPNTANESMQGELF
jgi:ribosomal protein S27E